MSSADNSTPAAALTTATTPNTPTPATTAAAAAPTTTNAPAPNTTTTPTPATTPAPAPAPAPTTSTPAPAPTPNSSPPPAPIVTSTSTAPPPKPTTQLVTSTITSTTSSRNVLTTVVTTSAGSSTDSAITGNAQTTGAPTSTTSPTSKPSGLGTGDKTAIAVIIPLVVVALLAIAALVFWRRRNKQKADEETMRKEMEAYGYNINTDLPSATKDEFVEDDGGYRGWGAAGTSSINRKTSTNASSGRNNFSDNGNMYQPHGSPTQVGPGIVDEPISPRQRHGTMDSDTMGPLGGPAVPSTGTGGLHRASSNASSTYSVGARSHNSEHYPVAPNQQDYYTDNSYYQPGPYDPYNFQFNQPPSQPPSQPQGQPVMRDGPGRRLTQIHDGYPQAREGGIARNF